MTERDSKTGRFARVGVPTTDPFRQGMMPSKAAMDLSLETLAALDRAIAQVRSDIERVTIK